MSTRNYKGVEEARSTLPLLLEQAANGKATVIARHGRPIAALVPLESYSAAGTQQSLLPYRGSGKGLWGKQIPASIRKLRDEWNR